MLHIKHSKNVLKNCYVTTQQLHKREEDKISPHHVGYRNNLDTENAIAKFIAMIMQKLDNGENYLGIFINLRKAFDSSSHCKFTEKLRQIGIDGIVLSSIQGYIKDRFQYV